MEICKNLSMRLGIVGCWNISDIYVRNAKLFNDVEIIVCSDIIPPAADAPTYVKL
jgi:hypothetical protein